MSISSEFVSCTVLNMSFHYLSLSLVYGTPIHRTCCTLTHCSWGTRLVNTWRRANRRVHSNSSRFVAVSTQTWLISNENSWIYVYIKMKHHLKSSKHVWKFSPSLLSVQLLLGPTALPQRRGIPVPTNPFSQWACRGRGTTQATYTLAKSMIKMTKIDLKQQHDQTWSC